MRYPIVLHWTEEGYSAQCPALLGCWSEGTTQEGALANIADAIQDYLAAMHSIADGSL